MKVLLGVSGGIAAYKAAELTRALQQRGFAVQVVMTAGAERFVTPLTFAALSGHPVLTSLWQPAASELSSGESATFAMEHIQVAQECNALVIAPATANIIAKFAHGIADDLLTTIFLATKAPVLLAPAMNVNMWQHAATQHNLELLRSRGVQIIAPGGGYLACGMVGEGRLADPAEIADIVSTAIEQQHDLAGQTILMTAGGTREPIDPVRYIGNRSSGRMGLALAESAIARGANVILITTAGATSLPCEQIHVDTAAEMQTAVLTHLPRASVVIMAAAVADYRVAAPAEQKQKKQQSLTLELIVNDDILRRICADRRPGTTVIGFAAETEDLLSEGRRKLHEKGADAIIANDVSSPDQGIDSDRNAGILITHDFEVELPLSSKRIMADRIFDQLANIRAARKPALTLA